MYKITDDDIEYCKWVTALVYRQRYQRRPNEDEMQDAMEAMCNAATTWDETKGRAFPSWARIYIERAMIAGRPGRLRRTGQPVKPEMYLMGSQEEYDETWVLADNVTVTEEEILNGITVAEILQKFPLKLRSALIRHHFLGDEYKDMAEEFGYKSGGSIATMLWKWYKRIRIEAGGDDD